MTSKNFYKILLFAAACALVGCEGCDASPAQDAGVDAGSDSAVEDDSSTSGDFVEPFDPDRLGWGLHVTGRDASDIYVAGGTPDAGKLLRWDGETWADEELPAGTPLLNWVMLFDDGQAAVVGNAGTVLWNDGSGWQPQTSGTDQDLWGVWGASADDVWAVGGRGRAAGEATVLRYDGAAWGAAEVPTLTRPGVNAFFKVWGSAADDVYVVGQKGGMLHYDGTELTELGVGTAEDLIALTGTGPDDILVVGGRSNGVMSHFDGTDWTTENIAPAPGVNGVFAIAPGEFWIAGVRGMLRRGTVGPDGFDIPRTAPAANADLHAVFGVEGYGLIAVGGNFEMAAGPYEGVAVLKEGSWQ